MTTLLQVLAGLAFGICLLLFLVRWTVQSSMKPGSRLPTPQDNRVEPLNDIHGNGNE